MKIKILPIANDDLLNGYHFYEHQEKGIGSYFLDIFQQIPSFTFKTLSFFYLLHY